MSNAPTTWLRRIKKPLVVVLALLLYLGTAAALVSWWLWPPRPYAVLPDSDTATRITFSRDGTLIAACSNNDSVLVWETATGRLRFTLPGDPSVTALLFSPDGQVLARRGERLRLFDLATGDERPLGLANPNVARAAFSPDGKTLLVTAGDGKVSLVDLATGVQWSPSATPPALRMRFGVENQWGTEPVAPCRFSPDGRWLAWEEIGAVRVFDVAAREERCAYPGAIGQLAFAPDGETWAVASENEVRLCAAPSGEERAVLRGHTHPVTFLAWSPDGKRLASVADGEVKLWDTSRGQEHATLSPERPVAAVRFSPDGRFLCLAASGFQGQQGMLVGRGESIPLWDLSAVPPLRVASVASANVVAPDDRVLAMIGDPDVPVRPWTIARRVPLFTWEIGATDDYPAFTPDGKLLILAGHTTTIRGKLGTWLTRGAGDGDGYQYKWVEVGSWQVRAVLDTDAPGVLSPDGRLLATGGGDMPVRLWRVPPRHPLGPGLVLMGLISVLVVAIVSHLRRRQGRVAKDGPTGGPLPDATPP